jgi:alternate signal-mediated exported protein
MQRLTKAAMATGAAALLLMGGTGTMAYWTAQSTATAPIALASGSFTIAGTTCTDWVYAASMSDKGDTVDAIVPGDSVTTNCTYNLSGTGTNLALAGAKVNTPTWNTLTSDAVLTSALGTASVGSITFAGDPKPVDSTTGMFSDGSTIPIASGGTVVTVQINVTFPLGSSVDNSTLSATALKAALQDVSVTFFQGNSAISGS